MTEQELRDALEGLYAYDSGARGSGIHDEALRQRCIAAIKAIPYGPHELAPRLWLSRLIRDMWLSENALSQGYGIEDAISFLKWLEEYMDFPSVL
jgi:hypothetical protein